MIGAYPYLKDGTAAVLTLAGVTQPLRLPKPVADSTLCKFKLKIPNPTAQLTGSAKVDLDPFKASIRIALYAEHTRRHRLI